MSSKRRARATEVIQPQEEKIKTNVLIRPANISQALFIKSIKNNLITIGSGYAGTGKSLLSLYIGLTYMNNQESPIKNIYYIRANVGLEEERGLGFMPGSLKEKTLSLAYPVLDSLSQFMSYGQATYLVESGKIEVLPIALIRGRSLDNSFIILDESQNASPSMMKTMLTRISHNSKLVIIGDSRQRDVGRYQDGLADVCGRLQGLEGVGIVEFKREDIVRNSIIPEILARYED